jgi:hypothetical protein
LFLLCMNSRRHSSNLSPTIYQVNSHHCHIAIEMNRINAYFDEEARLAALALNEGLIARMKEHTDMSDAEVDKFAYYMVAIDYFKQPDHCGGVIEPGTKHYRSDGTEHTLADVSWRHMLKEIENEIKKQPEDRRTEMYKNVVSPVYGAKKIPDWEREPVNPNAEPKTPFSTPKTV